MKSSELLDSHHKGICRMVEQNHVRNPHMFGSLLHGDDTGCSDLDLLVDALPGVPVEVLTPANLTPKFRDRVLRKAVSV